MTPRNTSPVPFRFVIGRGDPSGPTAAAEDMATALLPARRGLGPTAPLPHNSAQTPDTHDSRLTTQNSALGTQHSALRREAQPDVDQPDEPRRRGQQRSPLVQGRRLLRSPGQE